MSEVFPFPPNWATPLVERLEWLTDVITAQSDVEERIPIRTNPRKSLECEYVLNDYDQSRLDALLWGWQTTDYAFPLWTDGQRLSAELTSGSTTIPCTTAGYTLTAPKSVILWVDSETFEVVTYTAVNASSLTVNATVSTWPAGTRLYPVETATIYDVVPVHHHTSHLSQTVIRFDLGVDLGYSEFTSIYTYQSYQSTEVLARKHNWINGLPTDYRRRTSILDYQAGEVYMDDLPGLPHLVSTYRTLLEDKADIVEWRQRLFDLRGRHADFWFPLWHRNFEIVGTIGVSDDTFSIKSLDFADAYDPNDGRQDIALLHRDGTWYYRRIIAAAPGAGNTDTLQIDSTLGISCTNDDFTVATFLMMSRFDSDAVEIAYHTDCLAECVVDIRSSLEDPYEFANEAPPASPTPPPTTPPTPPTPEEPPSPPSSYDYTLDMTVANHQDFAIGAGADIICRFIFTGTSGESYSHFTSVLLATGPCIKLAIDQYGYIHDNCAEEKSASVATDDTYTDWVVDRNVYIYLRVSNSSAAGTVRLAWNGENIYY